jgi:hypothetical protein
VSGATKKDETAFVKRVLDLYAAALAGSSDSHPEDDREVRTVAFGLAAITQALNDRKAKYGHDQFRLVEGGIPLATDIVDAITGASVIPFGHSSIMCVAIGPAGQSASKAK